MTNQIGMPDQHKQIDIPDEHKQPNQHKQLEMPDRHALEYEQICEHYRQGVRSIFEVSKMYFIFQAGLFTALGFIISHSELKVVRGIPWPTNILMLIISSIGLIAGPGAWVIGQTFFRYHNANMERAIVLEQMYGMESMTKIQGEWHRHRIVGAANFALFLFFIIAIAWVIVIYLSFKAPFAIQVTSLED